MTGPISRILVPTDFSATSDAAIDYATTIARQFRATIHLLHVIEDPTAAGAVGLALKLATLPGMHERRIDEAARRLAAILQPANPAGVRSSSEVRLGSTAEAICHVAAERVCDLIVMGTRGRTGLIHRPLGSVAEHVIRLAPCPVIMVRDSGAVHLRAASVARGAHAA